MGLPEEDFIPYATHRGDHLTAQRATFANPQLVNEMAVVDGEVKGSLARSSRTAPWCACGKAIETYMQRKQPLIIIAGADYGQGSSRDWAAKGVRLAGVEAIVAGASSASTARTWSAWACCRWNSCPAPPARRWASTAPRPSTWRRARRGRR